LQLAKEVDELLAGNEEKFKGSVASVDTPSASAHKPKLVKPASFAPSVSSSSHLDAVPQATPINRNRVVHKKVHGGILGVSKASSSSMDPQPAKQAGKG
jgi:hypothetical protein